VGLRDVFVDGFGLEKFLKYWDSKLKIILVKFLQAFIYMIVVRAF
jgi:hypothetical protein